MVSPERESYDRIRETCPTVDRGAEDVKQLIHEAVEDALRRYVDVIKDKCTEPFREELIASITKEQELREEIADLQKEIRELKEELVHAYSEHHVPAS